MRYSFDVFDTLITRKTATPKGIFALMQKRLLQDRLYSSIPLYIRENFYELRIYAEELARYHLFLQGKEEVTLEEIYHAFLLTGSMTGEDLEKLQKLELEIEYACSVPIEENIKRLKKLYLSSHTIVLISDMYLSAEAIRWILVKQDPIFEEIKIFVSSQYRKQKGSGELFRCVKQEEKWDEKEWIHIGDNEVADKKGAEMIGICTEVYPYPSFFGFEKKWLESSEAEVELQLAIGTARNLRIGSKKGIAYHMGTSFGGNIIVPYVQWVILESIRKGIEHLYFIARDGYLLQQVADFIIEKKAYPIKTSYLYGSRKAWRMACFSKEKTDIEQLISFTDLEERISIGQIAQIFQVLPEELERFINEKQPDYDILQIREIAKRLNVDKTFRAFLEKKHTKKKELLKQYLLQEIDFKEKAAFVEVSGSGMTQVLLGDLLEEMGYAVLPTYFMRITTTTFVKDQIWAYMPRFFYNGYLVEAFCRAPHGQTIGYQEKEGKVIPIWDQKEVGLMEAYGYGEYMEGVCQFTKLFLERMEEWQVPISTEKIYIKYMEYLSSIPDGEVLEFIGELPLEVTGESKEVRKLAPCFSEEEIEKLFLIRSYEPLNWFYHGGNIECSINRCSKEQKEKIKYYQLHRNTYLGNRAKKKYHDSLSPFLQKPAKMGKKVVLYGAGVWGQTYYWRLQDTCGVEVVAWVDKAYEKYKGNGLEIKEISILKKCSYDQILICVKDQLAVEEIRKELVEEGLEAKKIYWVQEICR